MEEEELIDFNDMENNLDKRNSNHPSFKEFNKIIGHKRTNSLNFRKTRIMSSDMGNLQDLYHSLQKRFKTNVIYVYLNAKFIEPHEKKTSIKGFNALLEFEKIPEKLNLHHMKGFDCVRRENLVVIQKKYSSYEKNKNDKANQDYETKSYRLLSKCKHNYLQYKKQLERIDVNKGNSVYLTHLTNRKSYEDLYLERAKNKEEDDDDISFENVYFNHNREKVIEIEPGFSKSQRYMDVLHTVDSEESNNKVYDDKRLYFYQYLREKTMFQTGFEFKKKKLAVIKIDNNKHKFNYKAMNLMLEKQLKESKRRENIFSDKNLKKKLQHTRSRTYCATFLNSCLKKLAEDEEKLKNNKLNKEKSKLLYNRLGEQERKEEIDRDYKSKLLELNKNEYKIHVDPKTFKMIKEKTIKFKPINLKINN